MNELNNKLDNINELITRIDAKVLEINTKLDELIKALHAYDDDNIYSGYDEPNVALLKAAGLYNEKVAPCRGHDVASWDEERMNIIGQNGNEGLHYTDVDENEFDDYGKRVVEDKDKNKSNNNSANTRVEEKLIGGYGVPNNAKTGKKKSAIVEHQKYPPHKH
jgi:hypothetical protein